jgi:uncharacterized protein
VHLRPLALIAVALLLPRPVSAQPVEPPASPASPAPQVAGGQRWRGQITWQDGSLDFIVSLTTTEAGATGTMDIPAQGLTNGKLDDLVITADSMSFTLKPPGAPEPAWARFSVKIAEDAQTASGDLAQNGMSMPVTMTLLQAGEDADIGPKRPQTPRPPYPYPVREVTYHNGEVTLAATLTLPEGAGPHPAVILITGSGQQDRDETLFAHKPFLVIADHFARNGIATLRADDRGIGGSSGPVDTATTDDFAGDALAGVEYLSTLPELDRARIGLVGHSEGGLVAPMCAVQSEKVAFIVMLAGPGLPGDEILALQTELIMRDQGADEATIQSQLEQSKRIYALLAEGADDETVRALVLEIAEEQVARLEASGEAGAAQAAAMRPQMEAVVNQQAGQVCSPWFRRFVVYDPRPTLAQVRCPVLALNGEFDRQVPPESNLAEIRKALGEGGNTDVTVTMLPGLNHLFQTCDETSAMDYDQIEETFAPGALDTITAWVRARTLER